MNNGSSKNTKSDSNEEGSDSVEPTPSSSVYFGKNFVLKSEFFQSNQEKLSPFRQQRKDSLDTTIEKSNPLFSSDDFKEKTEEKTSVLLENDTSNEFNDEKAIMRKKKQIKTQIEDNNAEGMSKLIQKEKGCRYFQRKIKEDPKYANEILYPSLKKYMFELIVDQFGNYLYQEFLDVLDETNFDDYLNFVAINFIKIAFSTHGTRVIQGLLQRVQIETPKGKEVFRVISSRMVTNIAQMAVDENANHIIQKYLNLFPSEYNNFIYQEIYVSFNKIILTKYGSCIIQDLIIKGNKEQKQNLSHLIILSAPTLICSQYGNYVYQRLILNSDDNTIFSAYCIIARNFLRFCKDKYSSNVMEKFFDIKNKELVDEIVKRMLNNELKIIDLVCNKYGNFIIQKILTSVADDYYKNKILAIIYSCIDKVKNNLYGQKLLVKLKETYQNMNTF